MSAPTASKRSPSRGSVAFREPFLVLSAAIALAALAAAAAAVSETEPNDALAASNTLPATGYYEVQGDTNGGTDPADFYRFNLAQAAVVEVIISSEWGCGGSACENLTVRNPGGSVLSDPFDNPMVSRDVYFSGLAGSSWYVEVSAGSPGGAYTLTVQVYPFPYASGEHVGIKAANESSAIVAFAAAPAKPSTRPYDLSIEGEGIYYGHSLKLFIVNVGPLELVVELPAGLIWESEDGRFTDFIVPTTQTITLAAWSWEYPAFIAVAESPYAWVPGDPSRPDNDPSYFIGPMAAGDVMRVVNECNRGSYSFETQQIAVWAVTAGQSKADFENLGASTRAYNDARTLLAKANVGSAITPIVRNNWLSWILASWPLCFGLLFVGLPVLFGLSQALRVVRLGRRQIDAAYYVNRGRAREATSDRREFVRQARERARERARAEKEQRRREREARREHRPAPAPAVVAPAAAAAAAVEAGPPTPFRTFMHTDAEERFDLDALNALDFNAVLSQATAGKDTAVLCSRKTSEVLQRLRQDVADPHTIDDILRDRMVEWFRESGKKADWSTEAPREWSGLVAESKAASGRKRAPLDKRLADLKEACDARGKWIKPSAKTDESSGRKGKSPAPVRLDPAELKAAIVQAVLDDIAASPKGGEPSFPLPVLSELAARHSTQRVNTALSEMFMADARGPFVVLHPSRYPDCDITAIRPPAQSAKAGAMAYDIYLARAPAQGAAGQVAQAAAAAAGFAPTGGALPGLLDTSGAVWSRDSVPKEEWNAILQEVQRQRERLEPPPTNYRKLPPYFALREVLLADDAARRAFLGVKWRGKPVGLAMLCQLFVDKTLAPEYDTDREYFEAELGDLERGDPNYLSAAGKWTLPGGAVVTRKGDSSTGVSYAL